MSDEPRAESQSLEDFVAEAFSGLPAENPSPEPETPAPDKSAAGEPQGEVAKVDAPAPDAAAATDPAKADAATAVAPKPESEPGPLDPATALKDYTPFTVDGKPVTGIHVHPEYGAVIDREHVPALQAQLTRAAQVETAFDAMQREKATSDQLSTWNVLSPDGKTVTQTLSGPQGLEAQRVAYVRTRAENDIIVQALTQPEQLLRLLQQDEAGNVVLNRRELDNLRDRVENIQIKAEQAVRQHFASTLAPTVAPPTLDPQAVAPGIVTQTLSTLGLTQVPTETQTFLTRMAPRFIRSATAADVKANPTLTVGESVLETDEWQAFVKEQAAKVSAQASTAETNRKAAAENAARLAAAKAGQKPVVPVKPKTTTTRQPDQRAKQSDSWFNAQVAGARGQFAAVPEE